MQRDKCRLARSVATGGRAVAAITSGLESGSHLRRSWLEQPARCLSKFYISCDFLAGPLKLYIGAMKNDVSRLLRWAVEKQYGAKAIAVRDVTVHLRQGNGTVWYGTVTVFELADHPRAKQAYGWYYELPYSREKRFCSALHTGPIASPEDAVRAEIRTMAR